MVQYIRLKRRRFDIQNQFDEAKRDENQSNNEGDFVYKNVIPDKKIRRTWSAVSLIFSILSVGFFWLAWLGLIFGVISIAFALVSRKVLGYFDSVALVSIIIAVFGSVFALVGLIFGGLISKIGLG